MPVNNNSAWAISGAVGGLALIIYSPFVFYLMDMIFMSRGYISSSKGQTPTTLGLILHTIVLFFLTFVIISQLDWA
jgi:hypothetical protein